MNALPRSESPSDSATSRGAWMALIAALLGWMFDGAEMGLFSMVGRKAIQDLLEFGATPTPEQEQQIGLYFGIVIAVFLVGAATGGVLFGWLGDRLGRVRAMSLSVLTYAVFTGLCGVAQTPMQIGVLRFIASLGMGGEWALGVSLVMEVWPNRSRAFMAGLIGAAANVGYLLVGFLGMGLNSFMDNVASGLSTIGLSDAWVAELTEYGGWRFLMILGTTPALLTFFFRIFVPESERWLAEKERGGTSHWATRDLLGVVIGAIGPVMIIVLWANPDIDIALRLIGTLVGLAFAVVGYTYPVISYLRRDALARGAGTFDSLTLKRMLLGAGLSGVALLGTWGCIQWAPSWADKMLDKGPSAKEWTQVWSAAGAIVGTIGAALVADWIGRRLAYFGLCVLSLASVLFLFLGPATYDSYFLVRVFLAGTFSAAFYGWLPLFLPELFRTSVRATAQGFGFNFGRILAAIGALQTGVLFKAQWEMGDLKLEGHPLACSLMSLIYFVGMGLIWLAPETRGRPLPE